MQKRNYISWRGGRKAEVGNLQVLTPLCSTP